MRSAGDQPPVWLQEGRGSRVAVMSLVPLKTHLAMHLSRALPVGVELRPWFVTKNPRVAEQCDVQSIPITFNSFNVTKLSHLFQISPKTCHTPDFLPVIVLF
ncbi:hypothetical protein TNCV_1459101 [Trichonephila clavipes]|nr:hypothetical protein TNCV_1459101 [Trichonephila clavipes]